MEKNDIYKTPASSLVYDGDLAKTETEFFSVSIRKFAIMYFVTGGIYSYVYFYQNWKLQKAKYGLLINPALRSIFKIFFTHSLFKAVRNAAAGKGIDDKIRYMALATIYVICLITASLANRLSGQTDKLNSLYLVGILAIFVAFYPLMSVQRIISKINDENGSETNSKLTIYNWIFIVLGFIWWTLIILGIYKDLILPSIGS